MVQKFAMGSTRNSRPDRAGIGMVEVVVEHHLGRREGLGRRRPGLPRPRGGRGEHQVGAHAEVGEAAAHGGRFPDPARREPAVEIVAARGIRLGLAVSEEDQPVHLKVTDMELQKTSEHDVYAGPSNRYCPAGVYEWIEEGGEPRFQINAQNCVHCKTCDVKDPNGNITWVPPEGGGGPNYEAM